MGMGGMPGMQGMDAGFLQHQQQQMMQQQMMQQQMGGGMSMQQQQVLIYIANRIGLALSSNHHDCLFASAKAHVVTILPRA